MCRLRRGLLARERLRLFRQARVKLRLGAVWGPGKGIELEMSGVSQVGVGLLG